MSAVSVIVHSESIMDRISFASFIVFGIESKEHCPALAAISHSMICKEAIGLHKYDCI